MPAPRNFTGELDAIRAQTNAFAGANYDNARQFNGAYTDLNLANYGTALNGAAGLMRTGWDQANSGLVNYTAGLQGVMDRINAGAPLGVNATGYDAATASPTLLGPAAQATATPASFNSAGPAAQAGFTGANAYTGSGGPLLGRLEGDAGRNLNRLSPINNRLQGQAMNLLDTNGALSAQDTRQVQQDTRGAYAARGLYDSNSAIGAEILNTDAARRQRMLENANFAASADAAGQQQIGANRGYALGVQGQGQGLSLANANLLTGTSTFNAGQANQLSQFNAGARNNMAQFDASGRNQMDMANANLLANTSTFNAGATNQNNQFGASLLQNNQQFNAGQNNAAQQFNVGAVNRAGEFSANLQAQAGNDAWARAMQYGGMQLSQAQNPAALAGSLMGSAPDYSNLISGYGADVNNTNFNAATAAKNSSANNKAALWSGILGAVGTVGGAVVGGPAGAAIGGALGKTAGTAIGGGYG